MNKRDFTHPALPGWSFTLKTDGPFRQALATDPKGQTAQAFSHDLNPGNVLYNLVADLECVYFQPQPNIQLDSTGTAAVNLDVYWLPIESCIPNTFCQLINKDDGRACYGIYKQGDTRWTHWQGAPKFKD